MKLLIPEQPGTVATPTGPVLLRPFQIAVEVSLSVGGRHSPIFPAILDTGHSHNFSIRHDQLRDWAGLALRQIGFIKVNQQIVPLAECDLVMDGVELKCLDGIAVYPDHHPAAPRLPLLGLRVLVRNGVRVVIKGRQVELTMK